MSYLCNANFLKVVHKILNSNSVFIYQKRERNIFLVSVVFAITFTEVDLVWIFVFIANPCYFCIYVLEAGQNGFFFFFVCVWGVGGGGVGGRWGGGLVLYD